ncbi:hypothetical protein MJH12_13715 [bacterium]|nr:hypothetical protein [bacterium]
MSNPDIYKMLAVLIEKMKQSNMTTSANALTEVIEAGCTATEILMGAKWHLNKFIAESSNKQSELVHEMKDISEAIRKLLSSCD